MEYDFAIIGAGAAGLQLAIAMAEDNYFSDKQILILEPDSKTSNDKTWSFWEKGKGKFDDILTANWSTALFHGGEKSLELSLGAYRYKTLRSIDFYNYAREALSKHENVHWVHEEVKGLSEREGLISTVKDTFEAYQIFDSRMPVNLENLRKSNGVIQHFLGWEIETNSEAFDTSSFTMMDYRIKHKETASFTYILPFSKNKALVEFTFFSPELVDKEVYESILRDYIDEHLQIKNYTISAIEYGVIPMYDYSFQKHNTQRVLKIGTAGGWVKASSGYSFKNSGNKCQKVLNNIKNDRPISTGLYSKRHALYDATFLKVLENENELGEDLFTIMYSKNDIETVFAFLDEETSFAQEVGIMNTFPKAKFGKAMATVLLKANPK